MKKILVVFLMLFLVPLTVSAVELPEKTDHEKVNIYIFRGHGCSHCYEALEFFYENIEEYGDYLNVYTYEVWNNTANAKFMEEVAAAFNLTVSGVPFMVIGDNYTNTRGFNESISEELVETALAAYQDENYVDLVGQLAKDHDDIEILDLEESCHEEGIIPGKYDTLIIFTILLFVVGGGALFIKFARK